MSKEDLRTTKTKAAIKQAFLTILSDKPFEHITVKEITELAKCNRNTFYLHYDDKYDLIEKLCMSSLEEMRMSLYKTYEKQYPSTKDWYSDVAKICLDTIELNMPFYGVVPEENRWSLFADRFQQMLTGFICTGLRGVGKQPNRLEVEFSADGLIGVIRYWLSHQEDYSKEDILKELHHLVVGLGNVIFE